MFRYLLIYMACLLFAFSVKAQGISNDTIPKEVLMLDGKPMTEKQIQRYHKQLHKDSIRANKRIWWSILGGPSYTPEASFGVGGAVLASFRLNKNDTISQRSFIPAGFNITLNGTFVFAGAGTLFFNASVFISVTVIGTNLRIISGKAMRRSSKSRRATRQRNSIRVLSNYIPVSYGKLGLIYIRVLFLILISANQMISTR